MDRLVRYTLRIRHFCVATLAVLGIPSLVQAQECFGLHRPTGRRTLEVTSAYERRGVGGPSALSLGTAGQRWWAIGQVGSDEFTDRPAPTFDELAGALGIRSVFGPVSLCGGAGLATETVGAQRLFSSSLLAAGSLRIPVPVLNPSLFGVGSYEVVQFDGDSVLGGSSAGLQVRLGVASYPLPWLGIRGYGDFIGTSRFWGMSVSLAVPTRRARSVAAAPAPEPEDESPVAGPAADAAAPEPPRPIDTDGDGIGDERDLCPRTPAGTAVDERGCALPPPDSDGDGVPDPSDACPATPKGVPVNARGCLADADGDGVIDAIDACPDTPARAVIDETGCPRVKAKIVLAGVNFRKASSRLLPESRDPLDEVASALKADPAAIVEIAGHTDDDGSPERNLRLSLARARAVRSYLIARGVAGERLIPLGFGASQPVAGNETRDGQARNRRVEMTRID